MNRVTLFGNVGRDAETRYTTSGIAVSEFSLATSEKWKDKNTGEDREETEWHDCVIWRRENLAAHLTKGKQLLVEGRLKTESWEKDGQKRYRTRVVVDRVEFGRSGGGRQPRDEQAPPPRGRGDDMGVADDEVPF